MLSKHMRRTQAARHSLSVRSSITETGLNPVIWVMLLIQLNGVFCKWPTNMHSNACQQPNVVARCSWRNFGATSRLRLIFQASNPTIRCMEFHTQSKSCTKATTSYTAQRCWLWETDAVLYNTVVATRGELWQNILQSVH